MGLYYTLLSNFVMQYNSTRTKCTRQLYASTLISWQIVSRGVGFGLMLTHDTIISNTDTLIGIVLDAHEPVLVDRGNQEGKKGATRA